MILDLGCGENKRKGTIGVDIIKMPGVDVVCDLNKKLPFEDNSVDGIYASHLLEHLDDFTKTMSEIWRVLKPGAWVEIWVPHFSSRAITWGDPTHKRPFGINTFECFLAERNIPYIKAKFEIEKARLNFNLGGRKVKAKRLRHIPYLWLGGLMERAVNRNRSSQKRFETHWCQLFPFSELYIKLRVIK